MRVLGDFRYPPHAFPVRNPFPSVIKTGDNIEGKIKEETAMVRVNVLHNKLGETKIPVGVAILSNGFVVWLDGVALFIFQENFVA